LLGNIPSEETFINNEVQALYGVRKSQDSAFSMAPREGQPVLEWKQTKYESRLSLNKVVRAGKFIGIVGPSGSGKTTLLESAVGFILPTIGELLVCGEQLSKASLNTVHCKTRLVIQEAGEQFGTGIGL